MIFTAYNFFIHCAYLIKSPLKAQEKFQIFLTYFVYTLIALIPIIPKPRSIYMLGYSITGLNFQNLHFLIGEIFVKNEYYFSTAKLRPIILDCGSNIGVSVLYLKHLYPKSKIYAFEPDPETFLQLKQNIGQNKLKNVTLFNHAVSNKDAFINFYISHNAGSLMMSTSKERMSDIKLKVRAISLSSFIKNKKIDFMKMDIEGSEDKVFTDITKKKLLGNISEFVLEYHHNVPGNSISLATFLHQIEPQYTYQLDTSSMPTFKQNTFQDILVHAYSR